MSSGGSAFISNSTSILIDTVGGTSGATAAGDLMIEATGSIGVNQAFEATAGTGLLAALAGSATLDATVTAGSHLSILASASVTQNANVSAGGTLDIEATAGSFAMLDAVTASSTANLRVLANTSILIGGLSQREHCARCRHLD